MTSSTSKSNHHPHLAWDEFVEFPIDEVDEMVAAISESNTSSAC
jgi:hypothetical protein